MFRNVPHERSRPVQSAFTQCKTVFVDPQRRAVFSARATGNVHSVPLIGFLCYTVHLVRQKVHLHGRCWTSEKGDCCETGEQLQPRHLGRWVQLRRFGCVGQEKGSDGSSFCSPVLSLTTVDPRVWMEQMGLCDQVCCLLRQANRLAFTKSSAKLFLLRALVLSPPPILAAAPPRLLKRPPRLYLPPALPLTTLTRAAQAGLAPSAPPPSSADPPETAATSRSCPAWASSPRGSAPAALAAAAPQPPAAAAAPDPPAPRRLGPPCRPAQPVSSPEEAHLPHPSETTNAGCCSPCPFSYLSVHCGPEWTLQLPRPYPRPPPDVTASAAGP